MGENGGQTKLYFINNNYKNYYCVLICYLNFAVDFYDFVTF